MGLRGLGDADARSLLGSRLPGSLDAGVREQIIAESQGNPLALLELGRTSSVAAIAGGFGVPASRGVTGTIERTYEQRLEHLPGPTRLLLLLAAAEPLGDPALFYRAAALLGIDRSALPPAVQAGLIRVGRRVGFAHPLRCLPRGRPGGSRSRPCRPGRGNRQRHRPRSPRLAPCPRDLRTRRGSRGRA